MKNKPQIAVGQRWLDKNSNRVVVILDVEVHGTGPAWRYEDEPESWRYCDVCDFYVWDRFKFLG